MPSNNPETYISLILDSQILFIIICIIITIYLSTYYFYLFSGCLRTDLQDKALSNLGSTLTVKVNK